MSKLNFYNDNMFRAYPFVRDTEINSDALNAAVVDAGFILAPEVLYDSNLDRIFLDSVMLSGSAIIFSFKFDRNCSDDRPNTDGVAFMQNIDAREFTPAIMLENNINLCTNTFGPSNFIPVGYAEPPTETISTNICDGFLITGNLLPLAAALAAGANPLGGKPLEVEPARIQNLNKSRVTTVCVANVKRLVVPACKLEETCVPPFELDETDQVGCLKFVIDADPTEQVDPIYIQPMPANNCDYAALYPEVCANQIIFADNYCIGCGTIVFTAGVNVRITQSTELNLITFTPGVTNGQTTRDETLCDYNGEIPFTEEESVAFTKNVDENGLPLSVAVPPFWRGVAKDTYTDIRPPIYVIADKEDPTDINLADIKRSDYLSGGWTCKGLITTINGVSAANVNIIAGANIQISTRVSENDDCSQVMVVKLTDTARGNCDAQ